MPIRNLLLAAFLLQATGSSAQRVIDVSSVQELETAVSRACDMPAGDTIYVRLKQGEYALTQPLLIDKQPHAPLVIEAAGKEKPLISGAMAVGKWTLTPQGWWKTHIAATQRWGFMFHHLYVNGQRATLARTPDTGFLRIDTCRDTEFIKHNPNRAEYTTRAITSLQAPLQGLGGRYNEHTEHPYMVVHCKWESHRLPLSAVDGAAHRLYTNGWGMPSYLNFGNDGRFYLENYRAALNAPGEWLLENDGTLYYIPRAGETPDAATCRAAVLPQLLVVRGTADKYIHGICIRNLAFGYTASRDDGLYDGRQIGCLIDATIQLDYARDIRIDNCDITHTGNYALWMKNDCRGCSLSNSFLYDLGGGGVKIGNTSAPRQGEIASGNNAVSNCIIRHAGQAFALCGGVIIFHSDSNRVVHNDICDMRYTGVSVGWIWGYAQSWAHHNEIAYNHIHHLGWRELSDMGGIYTLGKQPGTHLHHNVIHDILSDAYGGWGLYTDEGSSDILLDNNLVYRCSEGAFHQHYGAHNTVRNNILAFGTAQSLQFTRVEDHLSFTLEQNIVLANGNKMLGGGADWKKAQVLMRNNCYYDYSNPSPLFAGMTLKEWQKHNDKKSIIADPLMRNPLKDDFSFRSTKTAKRIGFKPFDISQAGVQGSAEWKAKARMSDEETKRFSLLEKQPKR